MNDDVVSRSGGFGMTATRITVSRTISIIFQDEWSKLILDHCFCGNSFIGHRELHDFLSRSVFMTLFSLVIFLL